MLCSYLEDSNLTYSLGQVDLVRAQLRRATGRYGGPLNSTLLHRALSQPLDKEIDPYQPGSRSIGSLHVENIGIIDQVLPKAGLSEGNGSDATEIVQDKESLSKSSSSHVICQICPSDENKKVDSPVIPDDFLCPISLELMRDPVIVATGQVIIIHIVFQSFFF